MCLQSKKHHLGGSVMKVYLDVRLKSFKIFCMKSEEGWLHSIVVLGVFWCTLSISCHSYSIFSFSQSFLVPVPPLTTTATSLTKFLLASVGLCVQPRKKYIKDLNKVLQLLPWGSSNDKATSSGISPYLLKTASLDTLMPN